MIDENSAAEIITVQYGIEDPTIIKSNRKGIYRFINMAVDDIIIDGRALTSTEFGILGSKIEGKVASEYIDEATGKLLHFNNPFTLRAISPNSYLSYTTNYFRIFYIDENRPDRSNKYALLMQLIGNITFENHVISNEDCVRLLNQEHGITAHKIASLNNSDPGECDLS